MFNDELFEKILLEPAENGGDQLYIVSGYASATMASRHLEFLIKKSLHVKIKLIAGMYYKDGLVRANHEAFKQLVSEDFPTHIECSYIAKSPDVHSKVYGWFKDGEPLCGFAGSANYSQNSFFSPSQEDVMTGCEPIDCRNYFDGLSGRSMDCRDPEVENHFNVYEKEKAVKEKRQVTEEPQLAGLPHVKVSLLKNNGEMPPRSGLNWGQRPEHKREANQAYINLKSDVYKTDFFPEEKRHFTVLTDDGFHLICVRAQAQAKAIETPHNNSQIGIYFRKRLGLESGVFVSVDDLVRYGRTDIDFYKIDEETYFMDFSVAT